MPVAVSMRLLAASRYSRHQKGMSTRPPLAEVANRNDLAGVHALLAGASQADKDLALARAVLAFGQRRAIAELLIANGADPNGQYGGDYGPIALVTGECLDPDGLQFLIDHGADVTFGPIASKYGETSMLTSVLGAYVRGLNERKRRCIAILLAHAAPLPAEVDPPLFAIHRDDAPELAALLDADPGLAVRTFPAMPWGNVGLAGATLLHAAVEFDALACIDVLLDHGADINQRAQSPNGFGQTPLYHCVNTWWDCKLATLTRLLDRAGTRIDPTLAATFTFHGEPRKDPVTLLDYADEPGDPHWRKNAEVERALLRGLASRFT